MDWIQKVIEDTEKETGQVVFFDPYSGEDMLSDELEDAEE